ncbi:uncharacterized protein LOC126268078 [Schistocerca gregaria]|uniref:uncharacterized protein LOC126268078 n=1 Tax=Schistocerca gregaria TaxID=7010 RepID=UPI00211EEFA1|nr:uncharacterized protein LOC126268078 [Schistocerca gregaria]
MGPCTLLVFGALASCAVARVDDSAPPWLYGPAQPDSECPAYCGSKCSAACVRCECPEQCVQNYDPVCARCEAGQPQTFPNCCAWHRAVCRFRRQCDFNHMGVC